MPALEHTDAALTAGAPLLKLFEPALLLPLLARRTFGGMARNRNSAYSDLLSLGFIGSREESGIRSHLPWSIAKQFHMLFQSGHQQGRIGGPLLADLVVGNDLVLGLLNQDQLSEFVRLICFSLADEFGVRLEHAEQFVRSLGVAAHHAFPCLAQHLLDAKN